MPFLSRSELDNNAAEDLDSFQNTQYITRCSYLEELKPTTIAIYGMFAKYM